MDTERLRGTYGMAVGIALLGLCPQLVLTTALPTLTSDLAADLHATETHLRLAEGMSSAGYAGGVVFAAQLAQRFVQRYLFLGYEAVFVLGSVLATVAPGIGLFFAGRVLQGTATGLMLISALPPLVTRFGVGQLPRTVGIVNVGLFGATTVGPIIGGFVADGGWWRGLFAVMTVLGAAGFLVALLGYVRFDPPNPDLPVDRSALGLTVAATVLPFFATSVLAASSPWSPAFLLPFAIGLLALLVLIVLQYRKREPLMPVKALSSQLPVTGTIVAMIAGAVFVTVVQLTLLYLEMVADAGPLTAGLLFWPMPVGLVLAAVAFGLLVRTRYLAVLVNVGLLTLGIGAALLLMLEPDGFEPTVQVASFALGFGAGATVSPGLFLAAFGVPSQLLGRAFGLVELLRSEAAFAAAPVVLYVALSASDLAQGVDTGLIIVLVLAALGLVASLAIPLLSGARLRAPDLEGWLEEGKQALSSPTTGTHLRPRVQDDAAAPLVPRPRRPRRRGR